MNQSLFQVISLDTLAIISRSSCTHIEFSCHGWAVELVCFFTSLLVVRTHTLVKSLKRLTSRVPKGRRLLPITLVAKIIPNSNLIRINFKRGLYIMYGSRLHSDINVKRGPYYRPRSVYSIVVKGRLLHTQYI